MSDRPWRHLYKTARWLQRRKEQLAAQPLCEWCDKRGLLVEATIAHHDEPHKGDLQKFWTGKLTSLCKPCHDIDAQIIERGGKPRQDTGADGWPIG
jgi:5-methylcytosine-specific restriction protein A